MEVHIYNNAGICTYTRTVYAMCGICLDIDLERRYYRLKLCKSVTCKKCKKVAKKIGLIRAGNIMQVWRKYE